MEKILTEVTGLLHLDSPSLVALQVAEKSLIDQWRKIPSPRLAKIIELFEMRIKVHHPSFKTADVALIQSRDLSTAIKEIDAFQGSPFLQTYLLAWLRHPPFIEPLDDQDLVESFWRRVFRVCVKSGDRTLIPILERFHRDANAISKIADESAYVNMWDIAPIGTLLRTLSMDAILELKNLRQVYHYSELENEAMVSIERSLRSENERRERKIKRDREIKDAYHRYVKALHKSPNNRAPYLEFAGWMQENIEQSSDSYFVDRELARARWIIDPEEDIGHWKSKFLYPVFHVIEDALWKNGFLYRVFLGPTSWIKSDYDEGHLVWATVQKIDIATVRWSVYLGNSKYRHNEKLARLIDAMDHLIWLNGVSADALEKITSKKVRPFVCIGLDVKEDTDWILLRQSLRKLPHLRVLNLKFYGLTKLGLLFSFFDARIEVDTLVLSLGREFFNWNSLLEHVEAMQIRVLRVQVGLGRGQPAHCDLENPHATHTYIFSRGTDSSARFSRLSVKNIALDEHLGAILFRPLAYLDSARLTELVFEEEPGRATLSSLDVDYLTKKVSQWSLNRLAFTPPKGRRSDVTFESLTDRLREIEWIQYGAENFSQAYDVLGLMLNRGDVGFSNVILDLIEDVKFKHFSPSTLLKVAIDALTFWGGDHVLKAISMRLEEYSQGYKHDTPYGRSLILAVSYLGAAAYRRTFLAILNTAWDAGKEENQAAFWALCSISDPEDVELIKTEFHRRWKIEAERNLNDLLAFLFAFPDHLSSEFKDFVFDKVKGEEGIVLPIVVLDMLVKLPQRVVLTNANWKALGDLLYGWVSLEGEKLAIRQLGPNHDALYRRKLNEILSSWEQWHL